MKKALWCLLFLIVVATAFAFAENRSYIDKESFIYSNDGKTSRDKPFRQLTFSIPGKKINIGDKIYVSGKITRDTLSYKQGETFSWAEPYIIISFSKTLPEQSILHEWFQIGKPKKPETAIHAMRFADIMFGKMPEILILGESFYLMARSLSSSDSVQIIRGERIK